MRAILGARGHGPDDLDDITQQTAERAIRQAEFDNPGHFVGWCIVVAKNLSTDLMRRSGREVLGAVPEGCEADVADVVASSLTSASILAMLDGLPEARRDVLMQTTYTGTDRREAKRRAVARFRVRQELRRVVEGLAAFVGGWQGRLGRRLNQLGQGTPTVIAAAGAVGLAVAAVAGVVASGADRDHGATRGEAVAPRSGSGGSESSWSRTNRTTSPPPVPTGAVPARDPRPIVRIPLGPGEGAPQAEVGPRKPDETHFFCGGHTIVTPYFCLDSPSQILGRGPAPPPPG